MGVYIDNNKFVIRTGPKTIYFDLSKKVDNSLKHEIRFTLNRNEFLAKHKIKDKISWLLPKYKHGNHIQEHEKQ